MPIIKSAGVLHLVSELKTVLQLPVSPRANEAEQQKRRFSRYLVGPLAIELARLSKR